MQRRRGCLSNFAGLLVVRGVVYGVIVAVNPWALHVGGRWTPFLTWQGSGILHTKSGEYPLHVSFYPSSSFSHRSVEGLRPADGLQGSAATTGWLGTEGQSSTFRNIRLPDTP